MMTAALIVWTVAWVFVAGVAVFVVADVAKYGNWASCSQTQESKMKIEKTEIKMMGLNDYNVMAICDKLQRQGFAYDVDFECLYGAGWAIVGFVAHNAAAATAILESVK